MHGVGLDLDVRSWFSSPQRGSRRARRKVPAAQVPADLIAKALAS
jgi:hypothetical protein